VVSARQTDGGGEADALTAFPDTLIGTDSHTTMINGLGVVGWGVGGIEAEAALLGQPLYQPMPVVIGFRLVGELPSGSTATDLVLTVTEMLRHHGVVGKFVEFYGPGLSRLSVADRATISNMSPEFGATATLFPIDDETLRYLRMTGRSGRSSPASRRMPRNRACSGPMQPRIRPSARPWGWSSNRWNPRSPVRGARRIGLPFVACVRTSGPPS